MHQAFSPSGIVDRTRHRLQVLYDIVNRWLVIFFLSPEWAVSSLLRTFIWCLLWIYEAFYIIGRPDADVWWLFKDDLATSVIEQVFLWMVLIDYTMHLIMAPHKLVHILSVLSLLDVITMPIFSLVLRSLFTDLLNLPVGDCGTRADDAATSWFNESDPDQVYLNYSLLPDKGTCGPFDPRPVSFLSQFGWLRFLRLYGTKYTIQKLGLFSPTQLAMFSLMLSVVSIFSTFASVVFWLEAPAGDFTNWGHFWYFAVVTFSTVGYGDYSPETTPAQIIVIVGIVVAVTWIPMQVTNLNNELNAERQVVGTLPKARLPFMLLVGDVLQEQLDMFLHQHFSGSAQKLHVVVLTPHSPEGYLLPDFTSQQKSRIAIVQGDVLNYSKLNKQATTLDFRCAQGVFVFNDVRSRHQMREDHRTTARLLGLTKRVQPHLIHAQYKLWNDVSVAQDLGVTKIVSMNHLKMRLMAKSCSDCMGVTALLANLLSAGLRLDHHSSMQGQELQQLQEQQKLLTQSLPDDPRISARSSGIDVAKKRRVSFYSKKPAGTNGGGPAGQGGGRGREWNQEYAAGARNDLLVKPLPPGLWGMRFFEAIETVYLKSGALLLGILNDVVGTSEDASALATPWQTRLESNMMGVWVADEESLFLAYEIYAFSSVSKAGSNGTAQAKATAAEDSGSPAQDSPDEPPRIGACPDGSGKFSGSGKINTNKSQNTKTWLPDYSKSPCNVAAGQVSSARLIQKWHRQAQAKKEKAKATASGKQGKSVLKPPEEALKSKLPKPKGIERLVLVLGFPKNLAHLVRQLSKHGFSIVVLSPELSEPQTESKLAKMPGVRREVGSPFVRDDLARAGLLESRLRKVLIFNEGLKPSAELDKMEKEESMEVGDLHCMVVAAKVRGVLGRNNQHARRIAILVEVAAYSSLIQLDRSSWWPNDVRAQESYLLSPIFCSGGVYTDAMLFPLMTSGDKEGLINVVQQLLDNTTDKPSLTQEPLPSALVANWRERAPPTYAHLVRECLSRRWIPIGLLRFRGGPRVQGSTVPFVYTHPEASTCLVHDDRVFVVRTKSDDFKLFGGTTFAGTIDKNLDVVAVKKPDHAAVGADGQPSSISREGSELSETTLGRLSRVVSETSDHDLLLGGVMPAEEPIAPPPDPLASVVGAERGASAPLKRQESKGSLKKAGSFSFAEDDLSSARSLKAGSNGPLKNSLRSARESGASDEKTPGAPSARGSSRCSARRGSAPDTIQLSPSKLGAGTSGSGGLEKISVDVPGTSSGSTGPPAKIEGSLSPDRWGRRIATGSPAQKVQDVTVSVDHQAPSPPKAEGDSPYQKVCAA